MAIAVKLDDLLHDRRMTLTELADRIGMTLANLSILKTGKARGDPLLDARGHLRRRSLQPGDLLAFERERAERGRPAAGANGARADERRELMKRSCRSTSPQAVSPSFSAPWPCRGEEGRDHAPPQRAAVRLRP